MGTYLDMLGPFQAPLTFLLVIAGPPIFRTLATGVKRFLDPKLGGQPKAYAYNPAAVEPRRIPRAVFWIVGIHTAVFAYIYYYLQPFNLFTRYFLPVTANARILHSAIHSDETGRASPIYPNPAYQHSSQPGHVATTYLDILAKKLTNSLDNRLLYLRFGHSIFTAAWPRTIPEYMLLKLPEVASWYLLEVGICVFGICNVDWKRKGGYKQSFTWIILLAGMAEVWGRLFWPLMVVEGEAIPLDSIIFQIRIIFLGLLPILLLLLPDYPPEDSEARLSEVAVTIQQSQDLARQAHASLSFAAPTSRLLRSMDEMIIATPPLQKMRTEEAEKEKAAGRAVMEDKEFKAATDSVYGWADDDQEMDANGDVRKVRGRSLVANGMREHTRNHLEAQWHRLQSISEIYAMQRDTIRSGRSVADSGVTKQAVTPPSADGKSVASSGQSLKRRVPS